VLRSPTVLIASVGLWGTNVFFSKLFRIDFVKVLKHDLPKLQDLDHQYYFSKNSFRSSNSNNNNPNNNPDKNKSNNNNAQISSDNDNYDYNNDGDDKK
jgi:hypothetical protein